MCHPLSGSNNVLMQVKQVHKLGLPGPGKWMAQRLLQDRTDYTGSTNFQKDTFFTAAPREAFVLHK